MDSDRRIFLTIFGVVLALFVAILTLGGCSGQGPETATVEEVPSAYEDSTIEHPEEAVSHPGVGPALCMPCVGPHIGFDGKFGILRMGPGISF